MRLCDRARSAGWGHIDRGSDRPALFHVAHTVHGIGLDGVGPIAADRQEYVCPVIGVPVAAVDPVVHPAHPGACAPRAPIRSVHVHGDRRGVPVALSACAL